MVLNVTTKTLRVQIAIGGGVVWEAGGRIMSASREWAGGVMRRNTGVDGGEYRQQCGPAHEINMCDASGKTLATAIRPPTNKGIPATIVRLQRKLC